MKESRIKMSFKKNERIEQIDLDLVFKINQKINLNAETKTYYALALVGLLSVPLFSLFIKMLELKLFIFWGYKILFIISSVIFIASLIALLFSLVPKFSNNLFGNKRKTVNTAIKKIYENSNSDYYHYRFWGRLKFFDIEKIMDYFDNEKVVVIGSITILKQIIDIAWIAKKKFNAFDRSISLQALLIISMLVLSMMLIFKG